ncbi:hypothetical protein O1L55_40895 [Streptomyces albulus]|nr:hypothetical protein [Streptomyces noursei]
MTLNMTNETFAALPGGQEPESTETLASRLIQMYARDESLTREAVAMPAAAHRRAAVQKARAEHGQVLKVIVRANGWPSSEAVGEQASIAALTILLHADDPAFQLSCEQLVRATVQAGESPAIHGAYVEDLCAVLQGRKQRYGTQIDPKLLRPHPIDAPERITERRRAVGLPPLADEITQLLATQRRRL